jgi:hypothetical protein
MTSLEQREHIKQCLQQGLKAPLIAEQLGISVHTVYKWSLILKKGAHYTPQWVDQ